MEHNESNNKELYKVVKSIKEMNLIPCKERSLGMIVTVLKEGFTYDQYILVGTDHCQNSYWEKYGMKVDDLAEYLGGETIGETPDEPITDRYLNERFPNSIEGFKVTFLELNTTFMKVFGDRWIMSNNFLNNKK